VDAVPEAGAQAELMKTLLAVTEGRIYVEIDRARLTRRLAAAKEAAGDADTAGELLQEVAVETFGAMAKSEKIDFILEQVRLCLDRGDFVR
jgi:26S proteasome regulatory subunit N5